MAKNGSRTLLWLCTLVLGLQFCAPSALHAASYFGAVDELSLRSADPEAPEEGNTFDEDMALLRSAVASVHLPALLNARATSPHGHGDRKGQELLPAAGFQPSAP